MDDRWFRLGDHARYPPISKMKQCSDLLPLLPASIEIHMVSVAGDGGTVTIYSEIDVNQEVSISLPSDNAPAFLRKKPVLSIYVVNHETGDEISCDVGIRSKLEFQIIAALRNGRFSNRYTRRHRLLGWKAEMESQTTKPSDEMPTENERIVSNLIAFVESERYLEANS